MAPTSSSTTMSATARCANVREMRELRVETRGALAKNPDGTPLLEKLVETDVMGRFSDPARTPSIPWDRVEAELDPCTWALIRDGSMPPTGLDLDGLIFDVFLPPSTSRARFIESYIDDTPDLAHARDNVHPDYRFVGEDITKAWFVVHDVGVEAARLGPERWQSKTFRKRTVHGFINHGGMYAVAKDFGAQGLGTKYEYTSLARWMKKYTIHIEAVPVVEAEGEWTTRAYGTDPSEFACVGYRLRRRKGERNKSVYHWTHQVMDTLADLYVLASARAGHLLTITTHLELDKNLAWSEAFYEYSRRRIKNAKGGLARLRDRARSMHSDPYGMDMQVLYDKITQRLNDAARGLGQSPLPMGVRYGVHPRRVTHPDGECMGQSSDTLRTFPYQSSAEVPTMNPAQTERARYWRANSDTWYR